MGTMIKKAVGHLRIEAIKRAQKEAKAEIEKRIKYLEENLNWDLSGIESASQRSIFKMVTTYVNATTRRGEPCLRKRCNEAESNFIKQATDQAAAQYDMFVGKLEGKIGEVTSATLSGNHVWSHSILTVTLPDGEVQFWKTRMIINCSKLGNLFNQFPTRRVKAA